MPRRRRSRCSRTKGFGKVPKITRPGRRGPPKTQRLLQTIPVLSVQSQTKGFPSIKPNVEAWSRLQKGWRR